MRTRFVLTVAAAFVLAAFSSPLLAEDKGWSTDRLDDAWADQALEHPQQDRGWCMSCNQDWAGGREAYCAVRALRYPPGKKPLAVDCGENGGMTVMGWDRDSIRILYRVTTRARSEERARELADRVQLALAKGWLRPDGPSEVSRGESWTIEIKAWVPRSSDLAVSAQNGPLAVRDVHGRMDLSSTNGPVSLVDLGGAVQARVQNGPLHVALAGSHWDGAGLDAEAQNGPLNLVLPSDYSAHLVTGTINGPRQYDYAIESHPRHGWITTTLGSGGPLVRAVTSNGPFHIAER